MLQWRLEWLAYVLVEGIVALLPLRWVFRIGESLGGLAWHFMGKRRKIVIRNLRIAFAGEMGLPAIEEMALASFRRSWGNLISAARTAKLSPEELGGVLHLENRELLEEALRDGGGVVLLLAHMGNWELLSRLTHLFPKGSRTGAFYRPLNNPVLDRRVLARREADGTRMFSKRDNALHVARFLREGGIVGILGDQRVGYPGDTVEFFGRMTRASPLPSLLARRSKSTVLALSMTTEEPGRWKGVFVPVSSPPSTTHCMESLERAMRASPTDVFWFQDRWKAYLGDHQSISDWQGKELGLGSKPHRALIWLAGCAANFRPAYEWMHPNVLYEIALESGQDFPEWLEKSTRVHFIPTETNDAMKLAKIISAIDASAALPLDFILAGNASPPLLKACRDELVPIVVLS